MSKRNPLAGDTTPFLFRTAFITGTILSSNASWIGKQSVHKFHIRLPLQYHHAALHWSRIENVTFQHQTHRCSSRRPHDCLRPVGDERPWNSILLQLPDSNTQRIDKTRSFIIFPLSSLEKRRKAGLFRQKMVKRLLSDQPPKMWLFRPTTNKKVAIRAKFGSSYLSTL